MWSEYAQCTSQRWFGVSQLSCRWSILERTKFATFHYISHMTELLAVLELIDIIIIISNLLSRALFHFVTDLARVFAVHSKSGRAILAKHKHFRTLRAHTAQSCVNDWDVSCNEMQVSFFLPLTSLKDNWNWHIDGRAGTCSCFRTVTVTVSVIFLTVLKSLAGNARMVVWWSLLQRHEKRGEGKRRQYGDLDRRGDRDRRWGHVECGSWRKLRMTVRSLSKISCFTWRREKGANYARHLHHDLGSRKNNSSMCPSRTSWDLLRGRWRQAWK